MAARAPRAVLLPGASTVPPQNASPEASDSGIDSRAGVNQTCTMRPLATAMNSHSPGWPRMESGTQPPAATASRAYTAQSRQTSGHGGRRWRRYQTAAAAQVTATAGPHK